MKSTENLAGGLVAALLLMMLVALPMLRSGYASPRGNEMTFDRAVFTVANATSLCGFELTLTPNQLKPFGQVVVFTLGVSSGLVMLIVGGWALVRICGMEYTDRQIVQAAVMMYLLAAIVGGAAVVMINPSISTWEAMFQCTSALGNSGLIIGSRPGWMEMRTHMVLLPLAVLGGLGVPVVLDLCIGGVRHRRLHPHTVAVVMLTALVYLGGVMLIFAIQRHAGIDARTAMVLASAETINTRSLGMPLGGFELLAGGAQTMLLLLMIIGASPAGTGGGVKATTLHIIIRDSINLLRGRPASPLLRSACVWAGAYGITVICTVWLLISFYPRDPSDRLLLLSISAASTVGIADQPINLTGAGLFILSAAMLLGRFLPLMVMWWAVKQKVKGEAGVG